MVTLGKSGLVYALAGQLGFKVLEVNASSARTGRALLSRLQEATQSHTVNNKNKLVQSSSKADHHQKLRIFCNNGEKLCF